jgi:hypothetical protein
MLACSMIVGCASAGDDEEVESGTGSAVSDDGDNGDGQGTMTDGNGYGDGYVPKVYAEWLRGIQGPCKADEIERVEMTIENLSEREAFYTAEVLPAESVVSRFDAGRIAAHGSVHLKFDGKKGTDMTTVQVRLTSVGKMKWRVDADRCDKS